MSDEGVPIILVVDDERALTDTLAAVLERAGYRSVAAYSASQALEQMHQVRPALLISDVMMPGMNGIELAAEASRIHPGMKIFLISGHAGMHETVQAAQPRDCGYDLVAKPISPEELLAKVASVLEGREPGEISSFGRAR